MFTVRNLEKNPNLLVAPTDMFVLPPPGTVKWDENQNLDNAESYKNVVENLKDIVRKKRIDCWPPFQDFDK